MLRRYSLLSTFFAGMAAMVLSLAPSFSQAVPDAGQLLKRVRQGATLQENKDIKGQIRKRSVKVPFSMSLRGNLIAFQYQLNNVWNRFDLKFKDRGQEILSWKDGKAGVLPVAQYAVPIAGTDVTPGQNRPGRRGEHGEGPGLLDCPDSEPEPQGRAICLGARLD